MKAYRFAFRLILLAIPSQVLGQEAKPCPRPVDVFASMPPEATVKNLRGEVTIAARFDDCGRVIEAVVRSGSRQDILDRAALTAMKQSILSDEQRLRAVDGWYSRSTVFGIDNNYRSANLDWPRTHRRPRYVLDESPLGFESIAAASLVIRESDPRILRPPVINMRHSIVQFDAPEGREFWLFLTGRNGQWNVAARYRPVMETGEPVVKLAILCELEPAQCQAVRELLMRGLSIARAKATPR